LTVFQKTIKLLKQKQSKGTGVKEMPFFTIIILIIVGAVVIPFTLIILILIFRPRKIAAVEALLKLGKITQACRMAKQIIAKDPHNVDAHYLLGKAYQEAEKPELALMEFKTVNNLGNFTGLCQEAKFRKEIAALFMQFHQDEEALKEYLLLLQMEPFVADHHYHAGLLFEERRRDDRAYAYFLKTIELSPEHADAHFRLGKIFYKQKKPIEAKLELEKAVKYDPDNYNAYFYLGKLLKDAHDYLSALLYFEKAENDPEMKVKALIERAISFMNMNNYESAVSEFERAIRFGESEKRSEVIYARYFLALCYEKNREIEKAIEQWEKVYAKRPTFRDVAEKLSQYQEFRTDDRIKDFLTSGKDKFKEICLAMIKTLKLEVRDMADLTNGLQILAVEAEQKWRGARKMPKLIRIYRVPEIIDDSSVRSLQETMKKFNVIKGLIITSSTFSRKAFEFAETRPIDLYNKDKLREILLQTEFND
jgi:tetratricopeptide (TPR) repeat protein